MAPTNNYTLQVASPLASQNAGDHMEISRHPKPKTFGELPIDRLSDHDLAKQIADALTDHYGAFKSTAKRVAQDSGASEKTAGNWTGAMNTPCLLYFLRLLPRSPQLQAAVRRLTAMDAELDADTGREFSRLVQTVIGNT